LNDKARHIRDTFPDKKHTLDLLMAQDSEFLALCEDHDACVDALRYWIQSKEPESEARVNEYRNLIRELGEEILQAMEELEPRRLG
jgi:uncharacterized protein YdcH (DUF465 family)